MAVRANLGILALTVLLLTGCAEEQEPMSYQPDPALGPRDVVEQQVRALGRNAEWGDAEGIRRAYRFASTANRNAMGELSGFAEVLHNPGYRALLDNRAARYSEPVFQADRAAVGVTVTAANGRAVDYVFFLSRADRADCQGCWFTDAVHPGPDRPPEAGPRVNI